MEYEGRYLKGKRNGKGKEYHYQKHFNRFDDCLCCRKNEKEEVKEHYYVESIYEDEYLNGKRNGKGYIKEYYSNGKLLFEGEGLNGKKNGKGKEYYESGELIFEGNYTILFNFYPSKTWKFYNGK